MIRHLLPFTPGLLVIVAALAGCGGSDKATGVFAVTKGMTKQQVQDMAGFPARSGPKCWLYTATDEGTPISPMRFCFTNGHVSLIQTSVHG